LIKLALVAAAALFAPCAPAWNYTGHMLTAYVAYINLSPGPRAHVDEILRRHPDYPKWVANAPAGTDLGLEAFLQASVWPDVIKGDSRFWEPGLNGHSTPTPLLPGFPDMQQHREWHYRDRAIGPPGMTMPPGPEKNLVTEVNRMRRALGDPYNLAWLIHLIGDAHQPLHSATRYVNANDSGDHGGNGVALQGAAKNLHAFWDDLAGRDVDRASIAQLGEELIASGPAARKAVRTDIETCMGESFEIARDFIYTATPPVLSPEYIKRAAEIGRSRIVLAGYRIAAVLNERLE